MTFGHVQSEKRSKQKSFEVNEIQAYFKLILLN